MYTFNEYVNIGFGNLTIPTAGITAGKSFIECQRQRGFRAGNDIKSLALDSNRSLEDCLANNLFISEGKPLETNLMWFVFVGKSNKSKIYYSVNAI